MRVVTELEVLRFILMQRNTVVALIAMGAVYGARFRGELAAEFVMPVAPESAAMVSVNGAA